jgi:hypothetical protein
MDTSSNTLAFGYLNLGSAHASRYESQNPKPCIRLPQFLLESVQVFEAIQLSRHSFDSTPFAEWDGDIIGPWQEKPANSVY